jgi:hypothetical protein
MRRSELASASHAMLVAPERVVEAGLAGPVGLDLQVAPWGEMFRAWC